MGRSIQCVGFISLILLSACGGASGGASSNPKDNQIDVKTFSGSKDVWKAENAYCGTGSMTLDQTERYGIDLNSNYYWEVTSAQQGSQSCKSVYLYAIA